MKSAKFHPEILVTSDYRLFKILQGNRTVKPPHVARLKRSFQENGFLMCPILVNERHEIIDGQNRFHALQQLNYPVYYIKVYGYGLEEVKVLNANHEKWKAQDNLESYIVQGKEPYVIYQRFQQDFPKFKHAACVKILSGIRSNKSEVIDGFRVRTKDFADGKFEVPNIKKSYNVAKKIYEYEPYLKCFHENAFVTAMLGLFEHKQFEHEQMIKKLKVQPNALIPCKTAEQYRELLEEIYNYKSRDKVNLRF